MDFCFLDRNHRIVSLTRRRRRVLAVLLAGFLVLSALILSEVLQTVFFAVTVAYVLVPLRKRLVARGIPRRWASAIVTGAAFAAVLGVVASLALVLYRRRQSLFSLLESVPSEVFIPLGQFSYTVETTVLLDTAQDALLGLAGDVAAAAPVIALKLFLFAILLFALLIRPGSAGRAVLSVTPPAYHDVLIALNRRIQDTLYGIYVLQAATAASTFIVALVVFMGLGYSAPFTLAVVAALLQFIPVVGPGVLIAALASVDLITGSGTRAVLVAVLGAVFVGLAPDAIIRPRLAKRAADLPTSLYFIGFVGGVLTVGAIGFIAGPLVVAMLVETIDLLSASAEGRQTSLEATFAEEAPDTHGEPRPSAFDDPGPDESVASTPPTDADPPGDGDSPVGPDPDTPGGKQ